MTFTDIQNEVADRLNLTSAAALARIGRSINERYRWLASSIGIADVIERLTASADTVVGNRSLTFGPTPVAVEKLLSVFNTAFTPPMVLDQVTFDELRNSPIGTDPPKQYAIQLMGAKSVTVFLDTIPATIFTLSADVEGNLTTLSGTAVPAFAEDFHNLLVYGAMATELDKQEKYDLAEKKETQFDTRVSELRLYIAKSAYLAIAQGKTPTYRIQSLLV